MKTGSALRLQAAWVLYFNEVAKCLSIREAARRLNVSPSAISRQVKEIEDAVGARLLERVSNGLRLTAAGESVAFHAAQMLSNLERMQESMEDLRGLRRGHVKIAAIQATSMDLLPRILAAFSRQHSRITYECRFEGSAQVAQRVLNGDADVGVSFTSQELPNLRSLVSVALPFGAIMHPSHPLASRERLALADIVGVPLILPDQSISTRTTLDEMFRDSTGSFDPVLESSSPEFIVSAVRIGIGIAFQTPVGVERELRSGELKFVPLIDRKLKPPELTVLISSSRPPTTIAAMVAEAAREAISQLQANPTRSATSPELFFNEQHRVKNKVD